MPAPPVIVGREFSGAEESTGRRVMGYAQWGAFAERTCAHSSMLWPVPDEWSNEQASAFRETISPPISDTGRRA